MTATADWSEDQPARQLHSLEAPTAQARTASGDDPATPVCPVTRSDRIGSDRMSRGLEIVFLAARVVVP